jgi:hypothetical protein
MAGVMRDRDVPLLTVAEASAHAKVSERTIGRWIASGLLLTIPNGREKLIPLDHLQQLIRDRHQLGGGRLPRDTLARNPNVR